MENYGNLSSTRYDVCLRIASSCSPCLAAAAAPICPDFLPVPILTSKMFEIKGGRKKIPPKNREKG